MPEAQYPSLPKVPFTAKRQRHNTVHCQRYHSVPNARGTVPFTAKCICFAAPLHLPPVPSSLSNVQCEQQVAHFTHNLITCASSSYDLCKNHSQGEKERGQRGEKEREKSRERRERQDRVEKDREESRERREREDRVEKDREESRERREREDRVEKWGKDSRDRKKKKEKARGQRVVKGKRADKEEKVREKRVEKE